MKNIWKLFIVIPIVTGITLAGWITFKNQVEKIDEKNKLVNIFGGISEKSAEITKYYTYGTSLNVEGNIKGISKDNFEGIKLILKNGKDFEKIYDLNYSIEKNIVNFFPDKINKSIDLEELKVGEKYYVQIRLKTNNNKDYKYYSLKNISEYKNIEYYTLTKDGKTNKINIVFSKEKYDDKEYNCLNLIVKEENVPENVYDIVIDSGHGGTDFGEVNGDVNEKNLMLEYAKNIKVSLEEKGYKVKLTRDDNNTKNFTNTNMYDENGRISIACKTKAKYMISLHTGEDNYGGIQVYIPNNCDMKLSEKIANNLCNSTSLEFSSNNSYKKQDGIYQKNYTKKIAEEYDETLKKRGIEPYNITENTPRLYTIREVGGIATNAYVDGRNTNFSANKYYNSNQGIECYQISIGSLKKEKDILLNEKEQIVNAIVDAVVNVDVD